MPVFVVRAAEFCALAVVWAVLAFGFTVAL